MHKRLYKSGRRFSLVLFLLAASTSAGFAQTTAFTYQGKLSDSGTPANGTYDLQFKLFDALAGGNQIGATVIRDDVTVASGVFTVTLDFLAAAFPGANRWVEIGVRAGVSTGAFTTLSPLQPITSTPYALQSLNAATATNFSGKLAGAVTGTQTATALANNAVTTANLADASVTDAKITAVAASKLTGTIPVASVPGGSTNYIQNTATLQAASNFNISGNGLVGGNVGIGITPSAGNKLDVNGQALFRPGGSGGGFISLHTPNAETGLTINGNGTTRADLRFDGSTLKLLASSAGIPPVTNGIVISTEGNVGIGTASLAIAKLSVDGFGKDAIVGTSNFGVGVTGQGVFGGVRGFSDTPGARGVFGISLNGNGVEGSSNGTNNFGVFSNGFLGVDRLGTAGNTTMCLNGSNQFATCGSSLRYKTDLHPYAGGLNVIKRLQPLTYRWKSDYSLDVGFGAEDVAKINPLFVTFNDKGEVEGVKYDRLSTVFVNAFREQQVQIDRQQQLIQRQEQQIASLKKLVCLGRTRTGVCK